MAEALAADVGGEVVYDPDPDSFRSPWRTYRLALELTPALATHRLVLQDDSRPCRHFVEAARRAVDACPDGLVVFWHGGAPQENTLAIRRSIDAGCPWAALNPRRWVPAVAVCWPADRIGEALGWVDEQGWPPTFYADDEIIGHIARALGFDVCATVPSLIEHDDHVQSIGRRRAAHGRDKTRVAAHFIGDADPLLIDWAT